MAQRGKKNKLSTFSVRLESFFFPQSSLSNILHIWGHYSRKVDKRQQIRHFSRTKCCACVLEGMSAVVYRVGNKRKRNNSP